MEDTLAALHATIIDAPTDRTARLVYADALDESGDPRHAARAEFIRSQILLESVARDDPERAGLVARCDELFAEHWVDWWRPVCAAVGLPVPFVPRQRFRDRVKRLVKSERPSGAPYQRSADYPGACSIWSTEHGFTAQFIGGFPELLYFHPYPPGAGPDLFARWAAAVPLARLRFGPFFNDESGEIVDGPYLARVSELTFDRLSHRAAAILARAPHLRGLNALKVLPLTPAADAVRQLVERPVWAGLHSLTLSGITPPEVIRVLAERCTLMELDELSFEIAEVTGELAAVGGMAGALGAMLSETLSLVLGGHVPPPGPIRWPDYWLALGALARAPVLARLRTLRLSEPATSAGELLRRLMRRSAATADADGIFPDELVRALADGLSPDRLVRLELPAARLAPASLADLHHRFGPRFVPV